MHPHPRAGYPVREKAEQMSRKGRRKHGRKYGLRSNDTYGPLKEPIFDDVEADYFANELKNDDAALISRLRPVALKTEQKPKPKPAVTVVDQQPRRINLDD